VKEDEAAACVEEERVQRQAAVAAEAARVAKLAPESDLPNQQLLSGPLLPEWTVPAPTSQQLLSGPLLPEWTVPAPTHAAVAAPVAAQVRFEPALSKPSSVPKGSLPNMNMRLTEVTFQEGRLGLVLTGKLANGAESSSPDAPCACVEVSAVKKDSVAFGKLVPGSAIVTLQGQCVLGFSFNQTAALMQRRPLTMGVAPRKAPS
jgi:hypothetical protein